MGFDTLTRNFQIGYLAITTNLMLALANLPLLVALGIARAPQHNWPGLLLPALGIGPAVAAAFGGFHRYRDRGSTTPVRDFLTGYRRYGWRAFQCWALTLALLGMLIVDLDWARRVRYGVLVAPLFLLLAALVAATSLQLLVALVELPRLPLGTLARAALYLSVRRWYLSLVNLALVAAVAVCGAIRPALSLMLLPSFALYVVWSNNGYAVSRAIEANAG